MQEYHTIIRPLITEKGSRQSQRLNAYTFEVDPRATKPEIRLAVEKIYNVKVTDVRTSNYRGKPRRYRYREGVTAHWKKATVILSSEHRIDLF